MKITMSLLARSFLLVASLASLDACKGTKANMSSKKDTESKNDSSIIYPRHKAPNQEYIDSIKRENLKEKKVKDSSPSSNN